MSDNIISSHLISKHSFHKVFKSRANYEEYDTVLDKTFVKKVDVDQFSCMLRIHVLHYLFYSDVHKHFTIGVWNESGKKGAAGKTEEFKTVMIPKPIHNVEQADVMVSALTNKIK
jgi:hypothetical protein